jgi:hypothetical protein
MATPPMEIDEPKRRYLSGPISLAKTRWKKLNLPVVETSPRGPSINELLVKELDT